MCRVLLLQLPMLHGCLLLLLLLTP